MQLWGQPRGYVSGSIFVYFYQNVTLENATELVESYDCHIVENTTWERQDYWAAHIDLPDGADADEYVMIFEQSPLVFKASRVPGV